MMNSHRSMSTAMTSLRRLLTTSRVSQSGKVHVPSILATRAFSHRVVLAKPLYGSPIAMARLVDTVSRGYATTTTKPKRKTTVKKTVTKKTIKKAKKPKKKVVKKPKKRVAKKPVKVLKPKVAKLPSRYGISGYAMFLKNALSSTSGPGAAGRLTDASAQWKALSDSEKETWKTRARAESASRKKQYESAISKLSPAEIKEENQKRRVLAKNYSKTTRSANMRIIKDPNAPKKPSSAYLRYAMEHITPGVPIQQSAKESGARWKSMSEAEKRPYQQAYEAEKSRYEREKAKYLSS